MTSTSDVRDRLLSVWSKYDVVDITVFFTIGITGSATESEIETIVIGYIVGLQNGEDVVAADLKVLLEANADIDSVDFLQFSRQEQSFWAENPPETERLKIFIMENPVTTASDIAVPVQVDTYYAIWADGIGWFPDDRSTIRAAVNAYVGGLSTGQDVDHSDLIDLVNALGTARTVYSIQMDDQAISLNPDGPPQTDIIIPDGSVAVTDDGKIWLEIGEG
jgi:hypothetical protein